MDTQGTRSRSRAHRFNHIILIAAALMGSASCATALQRTMPVALANHRSSLTQGQRVLQLTVPLTYSNLWNAAGRVLDQRGGVVQEDRRAGRLVSGWNYDLVRSSGVDAVQRRTRFTVELPADATSVEQIRVRVDVEQRSRRPGEAATGWTVDGNAPAEQWAQSVVAQIAETSGGTVTVPAPQVVWQGRSAEVVRRIATRLSPYDVAQTDESTIMTEWRVTQEPMDNDVLAVRSRLRIVVDPQPQGCTVSVQGQLQYQVQRSGNQNAARITAWTDLDAADVTNHGWGIVEQALQPVAMGARDEPIGSFARAPGPEPELPDPQESWTHGGGERPRGVYATAQGGTAVLPWFGPETAATLVGRAFTADMQPAGQVRPMGQLRSSATSDAGSFTRMLTIGREAELSMGFFDFGVNASASTRNDVIVHEAYVESQRVEMPEFGDFGSLPSTARYYVVAVTVGRAAMVGFRGDFSALQVGGDINYQTFRMGLRTGSQRRSASCSTRLRGSSAQVEGFVCGEDGSAPSAEAVERAARSGGENESAVTRVWLRRVPDAVIGAVRPTRIRLTHLRANPSACSDLGGGPADLAYTVSYGSAEAIRSECPNDSNDCALVVEVPTNASIVTMNVWDRDLANHDSCGQISIGAQQWMVPSVSDLAPGAVTGSVAQGGLSVTYSVEY